MTNGDYQHFYSVLKAKRQNYRDAKRHLDRFLSTDFNVFKVIRPDENRLSKIIADLLNPFGSHGQQCKFLNAFLHLDAIRHHIKPNDLDSLLKQRPQSVICESRTVYIERSQRRIDILIAFDKSGLAIENKPWATDQEEQLQDYSENLQKKFNDRFFLLYLTPQGGDPSESSMRSDRKTNLQGKDQLICISYSVHILKWIEECCRLCESDKFRWFLYDFEQYIRDNFPSYDVEANDVDSK